MSSGDSNYKGSEFLKGGGKLVNTGFDQINGFPEFGDQDLQFGSSPEDFGGFDNFNNFEDDDDTPYDHVDTLELEDYFERANYQGVKIIHLDTLKGNELFNQFKQTLRQTDILLARAAKFLPESILADLGEQYKAAANKADLMIPQDTQQAIDDLNALQVQLAKESSPLVGHEAKVLRQQIQHRLTGGVQTLLATEQLKHFTQSFEKLNVDNHSDPTQQVEQLRALDSTLENAIEERIRAINDFTIDLEQLQPLVDRALKIYQAGAMTEHKAKLELKMTELVKGKIKGLEAMRQKLNEVRSEVDQLLRDITLEEKKTLQLEAMPVPTSVLRVEKTLGKGSFGEVVLLESSGGTRLAGKCFDPNSKLGLEGMKHEEEIYARLGEHPNIAKCYGIHEIEGKSMLVMEEIAGGDINDVFKKLEADFRAKKTSRSEFLGGLQQLFKGTLQGLAHFEEMGLVHKDIKGNNIRFDQKTNRPVIVDLGLAQEVGNKHTVDETYVPTAPPEIFVKGLVDNKISNLWDSFSMGKMLFPLMEMDTNTIDQYQFVPGMDPQKARMHLKGGSIDPIDVKPEQFYETNPSVFEKDERGKLVPKTDEYGNLLGASLKHAKQPGSAKIGEYGVISAYVDFMIHLTHPDPKMRLSPLEALKHPFMTQSLIDELDLNKVYGTQKQDPNRVGEGENELKYVDVNKWDELNPKPKVNDEKTLEDVMEGYRKMKEQLKLQETGDLQEAGDDESMDLEQLLSGNDDRESEDN